MTELTQVMGTFLAHEETQGLWKLNVAGHDIWHDLRVGLHRDILERKRLVDAARPSKAPRRLSLEPRRWAASLERSGFRGLGPTDLVCLPHERWVELEGRWMCPYSGPLLEGLAHSHVSVKDLYRGEHPHPIASPHVRFVEWPRRLATIAEARTLGRARRAVKDATADIEAMVRELGASFEVRLDAGAIVARVHDAVNHRIVLGRVYQTLLEKTQPKLVVVVVGYSPHAFAMTLAAKARGIPVVELQHGFIGPEHVAYTFSRGRRPMTFPDLLLTFGDFWRDTTPLPLPPERAPAIGFSWLETQRAKSRADGADARKTVVIVPDGDGAQALAEVAAPLANRLDPNEWRVRVEHEPRAIYDAFAGAEAQVGVSATAVFEGLAFGLQTAILEVPGWESMRPLIRSGAVTLCKDVDAIVQALAQPRRAMTGSYLWQDDPVGRFRALVDELIGSA